ncbi:hypothetical protein PENTCL1PPCAC_15274, partial [Pristionchus entomophagus]
LSPPTYRIPIVSKCLFENTEASISFGQLSMSLHNLHFLSVCFQIQLTINKMRTVTLPVVNRANNTKSGKVEVCVSEALFWYDDWPRLMVFIELWREAHNVVQVHGDDAVVVHMRQNFVSKD